MSKKRREDGKMDARVFTKFVSTHDENILLKQHVKAPSPRNNSNTVQLTDASVEFAPIQGQMSPVYNAGANKPIKRAFNTSGKHQLLG